VGIMVRLGNAFIKKYPQCDLITEQVEAQHH
jgi:hypothetical protein